MKKISCLAFAASLLLTFVGQLPAQQPGGSMLLVDFEDNTDGWKIDWGCSSGGPEMVTGEAHHGKSSAAFMHQFGKEQESAAGCMVFDEAKNFTGYKKLSVWVFFPDKTYDWQAQLHVRCGDLQDVAFGKLEEGLKAGWHQITMDAQDIPDITSVKEIGIQVKNWTFDRELKFHIDQLEALR